MKEASISCNGCDGPLVETEPGTFRCTRPGCGKARVTLGPGASMTPSPDGSINIGTSAPEKKS